MANVYAVSTGVWSNPARWNTGSLPTATDDVYSNGLNVTIDQDVTVLSIRNQAATGITVGGNFTISGSRTIVADIYAASTTCVGFVAGSSATITGNIIGGTGSSTHGITVANATMTLNGNATGGAGATAAGVAVTSGGIFTMVGNVYGGTSTSQLTAGVYMLNTPTASINITGDCIGGVLNVGMYLIGTSPVVITGNVVGGTGSGSHAIYINSSGTPVTINGNVTGGSGAGLGVYAATGGSTVIVNGTAKGGLGNHGVRSDANSTVRVITAEGSDNSTYAGLTALATTGIVTWQKLVFGANGCMPVSGYTKMQDSSNNSITVHVEGGGTRNFIDTNDVDNDFPDPSDVRLGVQYDFSNRTGTCAVPIPAQVVAGVAVDNTVGTALLTAEQVKAAILDADVSTLTVANSIGQRLKNCATVETTGAQIVSLNP